MQSLKNMQMHKAQPARPHLQKRPWYKSFYGRVGLVFLLVLLLIAASQLLVLGWSFRTLFAQMDQRAHWNIATELGERLQPLLLKTTNYREVERSFFRYWFMNRKLEFHLLDRDGRVLASVAPHSFGITRKSVDTEPIERALAASHQLLPNYGEDPTDNKRRRRIFSASRVQLKDGPGYIYLIIGGAHFHERIGGTGGFYVIGVLIAGLLTATLAGCVLGAILFFHLTKQLRSISQTVSRYREGDFSARSQTIRDDELGDLTVAVHEMASTIAEQHQALQRQDKLRRDFTASICHDLKSPIASVSAFVETLMRDNAILDEDERIHCLSLVRDGVDIQKGLIEDLFEISKLEAQERMPKLEELGVKEFLVEVQDYFVRRAIEKDISIVVEAADELPSVAADKEMLRRAINNLIENALRYSPEGGTIRVSAETKEGRVEFAVEDQGPGIPIDEQERVFELFYRVEKDRSRQSGGSGLGLAIVKKIIELHHGTVQVVALPENGSRFILAIPQFSGAL